MADYTGLPWNDLTSFQNWVSTQPNLAGVHTNTTWYAPTGPEAQSWLQMAQQGANGLASNWAQQQMDRVNSWGAQVPRGMPNPNDINQWIVQADGTVLPRDWLPGASWMSNGAFPDVGQYSQPTNATVARNDPRGWPGGAAGGTGAGGTGGIGGGYFLPQSAISPLYGALQIPGQVLPALGIRSPGNQLNLFPGLANSVTQALGATPNMSVWGPVMDEVTRRMNQQFQESTLPSIARAAQAAGQYGSGRNANALQQASDQFTQNLGSQLSLLGSQAAQSAEQQRNIAQQLGLDITKTQDASRLADISALLSQANLAEQGRSTNINAMLTDLARREQGRESDISALTARQGQQLQYGLGQQQLALNSQIAQSQLGYNLLQLQQQAQLQSLGMLPNILNASQFPQQLLAGIGNSVYGQDAANLGNLASIYNSAVQGPLQPLQQYLNMIGQAVPSSQQSYFGPSALQSALGTGLAAYGLYNQYNQPQGGQYVGVPGGNYGFGAGNSGWNSFLSGLGGGGSFGFNAM